MSHHIKRVHLPPELADAVANAKDADEMFALLNAASDSQLTEEMTLEEALATVSKVAQKIEAIE